MAPQGNAERKSKHTQSGSASNVMPCPHCPGWQDLPEQLLWSESRFMLIQCNIQMEHIEMAVVTTGLNRTCQTKGRCLDLNMQIFKSL